MSWLPPCAKNYQKGDLVTSLSFRTYSQRPFRSIILVGGSLLPTFLPYFICAVPPFPSAHPAGLSLSSFSQLFFDFFVRQARRLSSIRGIHHPLTFHSILLWPPWTCNWCRATCLSIIYPYTLILDPALYHPTLPILPTPVLNRRRAA